MEETIVNLIQSLGFPIAIAAAVMWYMSKIMTRSMDEAKERETNYQKTLLDYGNKISLVGEVLLKVNANLADARIEHKEILKYIVEECKKKSE